ncbi:MAG: UDP-N-acetylmuramoyl-L-alanyl-D-glutamate--2,6-diaminopimelate ligase [Gammaproteobacteria bacterium RIFCSPHIGHO2_12_FULL_40_19]|nr:MAG: UDP-N-acetylmuramoyl-L-alanyl-D-glutamate--2,6-diaminopimelate ligase [Gammaproteobacteria bacterium RIFCSPHIGHO2_12_FULL_40_19]
MKLLAYLLENNLEKTVAFAPVEIFSITNNSRDVTKNSLFLAYPGEKSDGRKYIPQAIVQGATAICYEPSDDFIVENATIPCVPIKNLKITQSEIAARFYDFPSEKIPVIGVTGTNGKTSITHFIAQALNVSIEDEKKSRCGIIGTVGYGFLPELKKSINTTPDGSQLQKMFFDMVSEGANTIAMEVSSHALAGQRVNDVQFHTAVFTNLTQDHLDFHITMEKYRDAKELLFQQKGLQYAVINIDDDAGKYYAEKYKQLLTVITYSLNDKNADIFAKKCVPLLKGFDVHVKTPWGEGEFQCPLIGQFNIANVLAVLGVLGTLKTPFTDILKKLSQLKTVHGRMQLFHQENKPHVIVDYAHTPDALEKALESVRAHCAGKLICVFGCGGDRDKTKRPLMGYIAEQLADHIIITNDNPRGENPDQIAQDILRGAVHKNKFSVELDRTQAIEKAIQTADKNDWILVAGKGHETEQIIRDKVLHHNDGEVVQHQLKSPSRQNKKL